MSKTRIKQDFSLIAFINLKPSILMVLDYIKAGYNVRSEMETVAN